MQKELRTFILALAGLGLAACSHINKTEQERPAIPVRAEVVSSRAHSASARYVGTIEAQRETPLSMQATGRVVAVSCKNGQRVRNGQILLRIDDTQARNALRTAEAGLQHAQDGYNRVKQVHAQGVVTDQKMVEVESQLAQARSLYDAAKKQVGECTLTAPCDGVVSGLDIQVGQTVVPGVRLMTLMDVSGYSVRFTVPEAEVSAIETGATGEMECAAAQVTLPVRVTERSQKANPVAHTYELTARIEGKCDSLLAGMVAKVKIESGKPQDDTAGDIVIPARCILLQPQGHTVWVAEQGCAQRRDITIGGYRADGVSVTAGLQPGDTLIVDGYQKLYNGCRVTLE